MKAKSAFNGVVVLTIALIIVKVLSALYRVPYQNILGDEGLYAYQQIYPIVALGVILSMHAIPSATTQALGTRASDVMYTRVLTYTQLGGMVFLALVFGFAHEIAVLMGDIQLTPMIRAASFAFLFVSILGVYRAYYQAKQQMHIPAYSQIIEQVIRVGIILVIIVVFQKTNLSIYDAGTSAIFASALGFAGATVFLMLKKPFKWRWHGTYNTIQWKHLIAGIVIFATSQLIVILWQMLDSFTILNTLKQTGLAFDDIIAQKGIYDRGASFIQMGLIVTTTFCFVLIPLLTEALQNNMYLKANRYANVSLKITIVISVAASIGLINLMPLMNQVFFKDQALTGTLMVYMLSVICVSWIMLDMALLQVVNRKKVIMLALFVSAVLKFILNIILVQQFGIFGASVSTVVSLFVFVVMLHSVTRKHYRFQALMKFILKLACAMLIMSSVVQIGLHVIPYTGRLTGLVVLVVLAVIGIVVLLLCVIYMPILTYKELRYLPFGNKRYYVKRGTRK